MLFIHLGQQVKPKGVMIEHGGLTNLTLSHN